MLIKKYIVNNMNEAMVRIRYELGSNAIIISQRKVRKPGIKGLFASKMIEVTAAAENSEKPQSLNVNKNNALQNKVQEILKNKPVQRKSEVSNIEVPKQRTVIEEKKEASAFKKDNIETSELIKEMHDMKNIIEKMARKEDSTNISESEKQIIQLLEDNDFDKDVIQWIAAEYKNKFDDSDENYIDNLKSIIHEKIDIEDVEINGKMILVGPTGVGKTTTIAKLAGKLALIDKKKVGLITIDTYRIGAVEQLKTYAEIMNIPFKVVITLKDMDEAMEEFKDCDVILIDTTGRSSKNTMQISELRAFVDKVKTDNISLVISSTTKNRDIEPIINGFKSLNYRNVIITKLDETTVYGSIINILFKCHKPVKFFTIGQNVPDDIKLFSKEKIIDLSLGEDNIC